MARRQTISLARGVRLPAEAVTQTFAFLGRRGNGKTYGAGVLVEGMLDLGAQVVPIDPVGNWYGLRSGRGAFNIPVLGGEHGDIPLLPEGGAAVADVIVDSGTSAVLDVSSFRKGQRKTFVTDFAEQLYQRKKTARSPLHIVLEEAQLFAPQRSGEGAARMLGAIEDIVRLGRNYGIGTTLISQRPQSVNKEVLNQVEALVVFQLNGAHERKAIESWVVHQGIDIGEMVDQLPSLPVGHAFLWSPQWLGKLQRIQISKKRSADTSATPKIGKQRPNLTKALDKKALANLEKSMAASVEEAKKNDPRVLRKRIAELERKNLIVPAVETVEVTVSEVPEEVTAMLSACESLLFELTQSVNDAQETIRLLQQYIDSTVHFEPKPESLSARTIKALNDVRRHKAPRPAGMPSSTKLRKGAIRMLMAMATFHDTAMTKRQVAGAAKMKSTGGTFNTYWSELKKHGFIEPSGNSLWRITRSGLDHVSYDGPPLTADQRMVYWSERLRSGAVRILNTIARQPSPISKDSIAHNVQMSVGGGTFNTYLGELRQNRLIRKGPDNRYYLHEWLLGER